MSIKSNTKKFFTLNLTLSWICSRTFYSIRIFDGIVVAVAVGVLRFDRKFGKLKLVNEWIKFVSNKIEQKVWKMREYVMLLREYMLFRCENGKKSQKYN